MSQPNARRVAVQTESAALYDRTPKAGYGSRQSTYLRTNKTSDEVCVDVESHQPVGYNWAGAAVAYRPRPGASFTELFHVRVPVEPEDATRLARPVGADRAAFYGAFLVGSDGAEIDLEAALDVLREVFQRCRGCGKTFRTTDPDCDPAVEEDRPGYRKRGAYCSPQCAHEGGWTCVRCGSGLDYRHDDGRETLCFVCEENG